MSSSKKKSKKKKKANKQNVEPFFSAYDRLSISAPVIGDVSAEEQQHLDSLCHKVNARPDRFSFDLRWSTRLGRHAVARSNMDEPGSLILKERPFIWLVKYTHLDKVCAHCARIMTILDPKVRCDECQMAFYCSAQCQQQAASVHDPQCRALKALEEIVPKCQADVDLVRAILSLLVQKRIEAGRAGAEPSERYLKADNFQSDYTDFNLMISHESELGVEKRDQAQMLGQLLMPYLPEEYHVSLPEIVRLSSTVNSNAHGLIRQDEPSQVWGLGLFPLCSLFNHSCYPNVVYTAEGASLVFRLIRPVLAGEELTVNYTGLYQCRASRRAELLTSKHFICSCARCLLQAHNAEELAMLQNDQWLNAIRCTQPNCAGFIRECVRQPVASTDNTKIDEDDEDEDAKAPSAASEEKKEPIDASLEEESKTPPTPAHDPDHIFVCNVCKFTLTPTQVEEIAAPVRAAYDTAHAQYLSPADARPSASRIRQAFESCLQLCEKFLHPQHEVVFLTLLPLINCCSGERDWRNKERYIRQVLTLSEKIFPRFFLPTTNYLEALAQTLATQLKEITELKSKAAPKAIVTRYREELKQVWGRCVEIYRVCCGEQHFVTRQAAAQLAALEKKR